MCNEDLRILFDELDANTEEVSKDNVIRAPFPYPGGKSRSIKHILPLLPHSKVYVEPFGGSGAVLLSKPTCTLDVFNDRFAGVVSFYRCMRDPKKYLELLDKVDCSIHSREDFIIAKAEWKDFEDDVSRAFYWYYMVAYSFGSLGRNFGRTTSGGGRLSGKIRNQLEHFHKIHERFRNVQVENQDWYDCMIDYDGPDTVFYIDPPYIDANAGIYKDEMSHDDHRKLLDTIFDLKGFCAVSGYSNPIYDKQPWDSEHQWESFVSIKSMAYTEGNKKKQMEGIEKRENSTETLWIKEAK